MFCQQTLEESPGRPPGSLWPRGRNPTGPMLVLRPSPTIRAAGERAAARVRGSPKKILAEGRSEKAS